MAVDEHFCDTQGNKYASVHVDESLSLLICRWHCDISEDGQLRKVSEYSSNVIRELSIQYCLNDTSLIGERSHRFSADAQKSVQDYLNGSPLTHYAFVSQRSANPPRTGMIRAIRDLQIAVRTFDSVVTALEWFMLPNIDDNIWNASLERTY